MPENSPPQRLLFKTYFKLHRGHLDDIPALLPEVWLLYDPRTIAQRGREALLHQRMDFVLLFSSETRVVLEVDGQQHYTDSSGRGSSTRYAALTTGDRDLRLAGYEVYRFGAADLSGESGTAMLADFFRRLFVRHGVSLTR